MTGQREKHEVCFISTEKKRGNSVEFHRKKNPSAFRGPPKAFEWPYGKATPTFPLCVCAFPFFSPLIIFTFFFLLFFPTHTHTWMDVCVSCRKRNKPECVCVLVWRK